MAIDAFEGFRRLRLAAQILSVATGIVVISFFQDRPILTLETTAPNDGWHITNRLCEGTDASESIYDPPTPLSKNVLWIDLCFRASEFSGNEMLIPYAVDRDGQVWGNELNSSEVISYIKDRKQSFSLAPTTKESAVAWATKKQRESWMENFWSTSIIVASIVIFLELFGRSLGWIARGFVRKQTQPDSP